MSKTRTELKAETLIGGYYDANLLAVEEILSDIGRNAWNLVKSMLGNWGKQL